MHERPRSNAPQGKLTAYVYICCWPLSDGACGRARGLCGLRAGPEWAAGWCLCGCARGLPVSRASMALWRCLSGRT
eukprot:9405888-Pyramimonas_sp.AAC.1